VSAARRAAAVVALLSVTLWLGGLVALGALVAPVVFSRVSMPWSADAMTVIFRRFDMVAMACAAALFARVKFARLDHLRAGASVLAAAAAVYEGTDVSPRIADLHASGVVRGMGAAGMELARLHDVAEALGKTEVALLLAVLVLQALTLTRPARGA
jgi:hypothetical protein